MSRLNEVYERLSLFADRPPILVKLNEKAGYVFVPEAETYYHVSENDEVVDEGKNKLLNYFLEPYQIIQIAENLALVFFGDKAGSKLRVKQRENQRVWDVYHNTLNLLVIDSEHNTLNTSQQAVQMYFSAVDSIFTFQTSGVSVDVDNRGYIVNKLMCSRERDGTYRLNYFAVKGYSITVSTVYLMSGRLFYNTPARAKIIWGDKKMRVTYTCGITPYSFTYCYNWGLIGMNKRFTVLADRYFGVLYVVDRLKDAFYTIEYTQQEAHDSTAGNRYPHGRYILTDEAFYYILEGVVNKKRQVTKQFTFGGAGELIEVPCGEVSTVTFQRSEETKSYYVPKGVKKENLWLMGQVEFAVESKTVMEATLGNGEKGYYLRDNTEGKYRLMMKQSIKHEDKAMRDYMISGIFVCM